MAKVIREEDGRHPATADHAFDTVLAFKTGCQRLWKTHRAPLTIDD
jgi:hypothetical protein